METYSVEKDLFTKLTNIYLIMPFYNYAYDCVKLIRSLCHDSRDLYINNQDAIIRMLKKQTLYIGRQKIDELTIKALKRGDRYKFFKFKITINGLKNSEIEMLYNMLDEMPELEFGSLFVWYKNDKVLIDTLLQKSIYKTRQELYKVLKFEDTFSHDKSIPFEYSSIIHSPQKHDMSLYVKQARLIIISEFDKDMNID